MQGFTKTLAIELGKFGVTANAIAPGLHRHRDDPDHRGAARRRLRGVPGGRAPPSIPVAAGRHSRTTSRTPCRSSSARARRSSPVRCCTSPAVLVADADRDARLSDADELHGGRRRAARVTATGCEIDQERIDAFADATGDHQWIHVDPERAAAGPFGATVAHGYLTLSLVPVLVGRLVEYAGLGASRSTTGPTRCASPARCRWDLGSGLARRSSR